MFAQRSIVVSKLPNSALNEKNLVSFFSTRIESALARPPVTGHPVSRSRKCGPSSRIERSPRRDGNRNLWLNTWHTRLVAHGIQGYLYLAAEICRKLCASIPPYRRTCAAAAHACVHTYVYTYVPFVLQLVPRTTNIESSRWNRAKMTFS